MVKHLCLAEEVEFKINSRRLVQKAAGVAQACDKARGIVTAMQDTSWIFLIKKTRPRLRLVPPQAGWRDVSVSVPSAGSDESAVAVQRFLPDINHTGAERDSERVDTILALLCKSHGML